MAPKKKAPSASGNGSGSCLLVLPPTLTARQRAVLHEAAGAAGIGHASMGEGDSRRLALGQEGGREVSVAASGTSEPITDEALCTLLTTHLGLDASAYFAASSSDGKGKNKGGADIGRGSRSGGSNGSGRGVAHGAGNPGRGPLPAAAGSAHSARRGGGGGGSAHGSSSHKDRGAAASLSLEEFVSRTAALLELEAAAEVTAATEANTLLSPESAQARGRTLLNLRVSDTEGGLLGRTLLNLVSNKGFGGPPVDLPPHKFTPHDVVALRANKGAQDGAPIVTGVVYRVKDSCVVVAVDDLPEEGLEQPLRLEKLANEVTYTRLKETLSILGRGGELRPGSALVDVLFGRRPPRFQASLPAWKPFNAGLDDSQKAAVSLALAAQDIALIHGPPGTGKTTAVIEVILQEVARGHRVMATAASNIAVDNLVERLVSASPKLRVVRMGHPARLLPAVLASSLEAHVLRSDNSYLAKDVRKEITALNARLTKLKPWEKAERRQIRTDLRALGKEERTRQNAAVAEVLKGAVVLATTLSGAAHPRIKAEVFDVVVVDEAAQALEAATWAGLLKAPRAVLAGDHLQLPPTILSEPAAAGGLRTTLFERLQAMYPSSSTQSNSHSQGASSSSSGSSACGATSSSSGGNGAAAPTSTLGCQSSTRSDPAAAIENGAGVADLDDGGDMETIDHLRSPISAESGSAGSIRVPLDGGVSAMLTVQYRMNEAIMQWSSNELYQGKLTAAPSVAKHTLADLPAPAATKPASSSSSSSSKKAAAAAAAAAKAAAAKAAAGADASAAAADLPVLLLIDTAGCEGCEEEAEDEGDSKANKGEALAVMAHVRRLLAAGIPATAIGIITPYNAQVALLREARPPHLSALEISSVDGFQGREKEAIVISTVRSNANGTVGFLADARRMNVAVTRARRHVALVCDSETVSKDAFLRRLVEYFQEHGAYASAAELTADVIE